MNGSNYEVIASRAKLDSISSSISKEAKEVGSIVDSMNSLVTDIPNNFQGNISSTYVASFKGYLDKVKNIETFNTELSTKIRNYVDELSNNETEFCTVGRWDE